MENEAVPLRAGQEDWTQRLPVCAAHVQGPSDRTWAWVLSELQGQCLLLCPLEWGSIRVEIWEERSH